MGKLKNLSTEIVSSLIIEPMSFNQIIRETGEKRDVIENMLDLMVHDGLLFQEGSFYKLTEKGKDFFSY